MQGRGTVLEFHCFICRAYFPMRMDNELILQHRKLGQLNICANVKDLFDDRDFPVPLEVQFVALPPAPTHRKPALLHQHDY